MPAPPSSNFRRPRAALAIASSALAFSVTAPSDAASVTEKTPGIDAPAVIAPGTADFLFAHNFSVVGPKVINSPTFLLDFGLLSWASVAARYATRSTIDGRPNEVELLGKIAVLSTRRDQPFDVTVLGGYDTAANSGVSELLLGREFGPFGLLGALRGFTAGWGYGGATAAAALGLRISLTRNLYLVGDVSHVLAAHHWDLIKEQSNRLGYTGGLAFNIPYSPHSVSLYVTNLQSHTTMEASRGTDTWMFGFEFDVPFDSLKRWAAIFVPPKSAPQKPAETAPMQAQENVVEVEEKDMKFSPAKLTIKAGTTVRWVNRDAVAHTATSGDGTWDSGRMEPGATFTHRFDTAGTVPYECTYHAEMTGEIVVEPAPKGTP